MEYFKKIKEYKSIFLFISLYISLLFGFFLGEDSTGGAFLDYLNQKKILNKSPYTCEDSKKEVIFEKFIFLKIKINIYFIFFN